MGHSLALANLGGGTFNPASIPGLVLWLEGNDVVTATGVKTLVDQSGNGNNAVQNTAALQPSLIASAIGGQPGVQGNGTSQFLQTGVLAGAMTTLFVVAKATTATSSVRAILADTTGVETLYQNTATTVAYTNVGGQIQATVTSTTPHIYAAVANGATSAFYVDGAKTSGTLGAGNTNALLVCAYAGPTDYWDGPICKVLVYSSVLNASQISQVGRALGTQYGIANTF